MRWLLLCWRTNLRFRLGIVILLGMAGLSMLGPLIYGPTLRGEAFAVSPATAGSFRRWQPYSATYPLGTDGEGRDLLSGYLAGLATSLRVGLLSGLLATLIGATVGFVSGYFGGKTDTVLTTMTDMLLIIPNYPILIVLVLYAPSLSLEMMAVILAVFAWPFAARTIRAQVLSLKERPFVDMARVSGLSNLQVIFGELMPNLLPYLLIGFAFSTVGAMSAEVGLALLGLGPSNTISLGLLIFYGQRWGVFSLGRYDVLLIPPLALITIFMAITLINTGMEEYLNPRLQHITGR